MLGQTMELDKLVGELNVADQQIVEIAKALSTKPKLLILDEPTSSLSKEEGEILIKLVRNLAGQGLAIIYISHRMDEIPHVADTLTILRDGKVTGSLTAAEAKTETVVSLMISKDASVHGQKQDMGMPEKEVVLSVNGLSRNKKFRDVSFELHKGEVLGFAGLVGSGRTELLECLFGSAQADSGAITVNGRDIVNPSIRKMIAQGIGLVPEDRRTQGLVLPLTVEDNLVMASYHRFIHHGFVDLTQAKMLSEDVIDKISIKTAGTREMTKNLSGGNQQKIVIGKWINAQTDIILFDEPTRGIDINAKKQIYGIVADLVKQGKSIIFVSSEMEELFHYAIGYA
ncbi:MAG: sugar ABC transporter ATP-binding protein [Coprococcus sp.]|nr:sugar ABC transporter ATP-binding protein [Coprococcus sp.]